MLRIVTFLWREPTQWHGHRYGPEEVNKLFRMIERNTTVPYEPVCICDDPDGIDKHIRIVPLWDDLRDWGRCWTRLNLYSSDIGALVGSRFLMLDLDTVILSNMDHLLRRPESFIGWPCIPPPGGRPAAIYNGSMVLMDAGARSRVWETLPPSPPETPYQGSDQAWISHVLGEGEVTFGPEDGVYSRWDYDGQDNACIVHLTGSADPRISPWKDTDWVRKHYR